jgi:hypothetical protein
MDRTLYVTALRQQSAYLGQLVTELQTALQALEQTPGKETSPAAPDAPEPLRGLEELQKCLGSEAEMFCRRLHVFLEESHISTSVSGKI